MVGAVPLPVWAGALLPALPTHECAQPGGKTLLMGTVLGENRWARCWGRAAGHAPGLVPGRWLAWCRVPRGGSFVSKENKDSSELNKPEMGRGRKSCGADGEKGGSRETGTKALESVEERKEAAGGERRKRQHGGADRAQRGSKPPPGPASRVCPTSCWDCLLPASHQHLCS